MKRKELTRTITAREQIAGLLVWAGRSIEQGLPGGDVLVSIGRPRRTKDQNSKLWPMLRDISKQVSWYGQTLTPEEWKDVMTAGLKRQKVVPGIEGGFVVVGMSTSSMPKSLFCDLVELIYAFGAERGVQWSEPPKPADELWRAAA